MRQAVSLLLLSIKFGYKKGESTVRRAHLQLAWSRCRMARRTGVGESNSESFGKALLMKVICNRGALLEALTVTSNVVQARTPKPVLQCVKVTAADDRLTIG